VGVAVPLLAWDIDRRDDLLDHEETDQRVHEARGAAHVGEPGVEHDHVAAAQAGADLLGAPSPVAVGEVLEVGVQVHASPLQVRGQISAEADQRRLERPVGLLEAATHLPRLRDRDVGEPPRATVHEAVPRTAGGALVRTDANEKGVHAGTSMRSGMPRTGAYSSSDSSGNSLSTRANVISDSANVISDSVRA